MQLRWGAVTDPGRIRQQNEDSVLVEHDDVRRRRRDGRAQGR